MEQNDNLIGELRDLTNEMAVHPEPESEAFHKMIERRGELIRSVCSAGFNPARDNIQSILAEGELILARVRSRRDLLRGEIANLKRVARLVGGIKSTLAQPAPARLDISV